MLPLTVYTAVKLPSVLLYTINPPTRKMLASPEVYVAVGNSVVVLSEPSIPLVVTEYQ